MTNRQIELAQNEFFHVYNRGNSKQSIFLHPSDYDRFISLLYISNTSEHFNVREILKTHKSVYEIEREDTLVSIGAFCLMENHFHLLASPVIGGGLSKFMQKLTTAYSMYFNTKYERTGSLFEGRFKTKHADTDEYLKYLFSYIHLNPITHKNDDGIPVRIGDSNHNFDTVKKYPYSTLSDYLVSPSPRSDLGLINTEIYGMYFESPEDVRKELFEWLEFEEPALGGVTLGPT